jgi:hypothetical protein
LALLAGVLSLGISAVTLLPFAQVLPATLEHAYRSKVFSTERKSLPWRDSVRQMAAEAVPYAFGVSGVSQVAVGFNEPRGYVGSALWPLAAVGLLSRRREKWAFLVFGALGLTLGASLVGVSEVVSTLPLFRIALNERLSFLLSFAIAALAALGIERLLRGEARATIAVAAGAVALALALIFLRLHGGALARGMPAAELTRRLWLQLIPLLAVAGAAIASRGRPRIAALAILVVLIAQRYAEAHSLYPTFPASAFFPHLPVLDPVRRGEPYRFAATGELLVPNISALYELEDVRGYASMSLLPLVETFSLWCLPQPVWHNRIDDISRPFLSFLNVRYVLVPPQTAVPARWTVLAYSPGGDLLENPDVLPRAFVPQSVESIKDPGRQLEALSRITDFAQQGVLETSDGEADAPRTLNGEASASIVSYVPQSMTIRVVARESTVVATSVPRWPGWRLSLDGRPWPTLNYNRAFVGFRVPRGRHTAVLKYWPESFQEGLWISAGTLILAAFLALRSGSRAGV